MTTIEFAPPAPLMNMNNRKHWAVKAKEVHAWRFAAKIAAIQTINKRTDRAHPPCYVTIELPVRGARRRDPGNYYPTLKAAIDGLVDAGVWEDDTPEYVTTTEPTVSTTSKMVTITITPRPTHGEFSTPVCDNEKAP